MKQGLVIVPAYNEEANIVGVIEDLRRHCPDFDIVVINDHSADRTGELAAEAGVDVIHLPVNLGIGGAVQTGFRYAREKGYAFVARLDGDGQHPADQVHKLTEPIVRGEADCVSGSRFLDDAEKIRWPIARRTGTAIISALNSLIYGQRLTDSTSGFRAYSREVVRHVAEDYPEDYPEPEIVARFAKLGFRLKEVPVRMRRREGGRSSITLVRSFYYMVKVLVAILLNIPVTKGRRSVP